MSHKYAANWIGYGPDDKRAKYDFYPTPAWAIEAILQREPLPGNGPIWEPASGTGNISKLLEKFYPNREIISSDIRTDDNIYGKKGVDFLTTYRNVQHIITNPPFKLGKDFILHALDLVSDKVIFLFRVQFIEGQDRWENIYSIFNPARIWAFVKRVNMGRTESGMLAFAWFVWDKKYHGDTVLRWIPSKEHKSDFDRDSHLIYHDGQIAAKRAILNGLDSKNGLEICKSPHKNNKLFIDGWNSIYKK